MTFLDCFAGGGLGRIGMEMAGHKCVGYIEIDKYARKAYEAYFDTTGEYTSHDIKEAKSLSIPRFDILLAGFPCQDCSIAGKREGLAGARSGLFYAAVEILRTQKPSYFIFENTVGLYSSNKRMDFFKVLEAFAEAGYDCQWQVCDTYWYLPQCRERFYFVGHLIGAVSRPEVFPIGESNSASERETGERRQQQAVNCLNVKQGTQDAHGARTLVIQRRGGAAPTIRAHGTGGNDSIPMIVQRSQSGTRRSPHCGTLRCEASRSSNFTVEDGDRLRRLTPLECFRLQGAPDEYFHKAKEAGISDTQLYKIAGNGMSVPVVYEIARRLSV